MERKIPPASAELKTIAATIEQVEEAKVAEPPTPVEEQAVEEAPAEEVSAVESVASPAEKISAVESVELTDEKSEVNEVSVEESSVPASAPEVIIAPPSPISSDPSALHLHRSVPTLSAVHQSVPPPSVVRQLETCG